MSAACVCVQDVPSRRGREGKNRGLHQHLLYFLECGLVIFSPDKRNTFAGQFIDGLENLLKLGAEHAEEVDGAAKHLALFWCTGSLQLLNGFAPIFEWLDGDAVVREREFASHVDL